VVWAARIGPARSRGAFGPRSRQHFDLVACHPGPDHEGNGPPRPTLQQTDPVVSPLGGTPRFRGAPLPTPGPRPPLPPRVANQRVHFDPSLCAVRTDSPFAVPAAGEEWQARLRSTSTSESRCSRRGQGAQSGGVPCSIATSPQWENRCASQTELVTSRIWPCIS